MGCFWYAFPHSLFFTDDFIPRMLQITCSTPQRPIAPIPGAVHPPSVSPLVSSLPSPPPFPPRGPIGPDRPTDLKRPTAGLSTPAAFSERGAAPFLAGGSAGVGGWSLHRPQGVRGFFPVRFPSEHFFY